MLVDTSVTIDDFFACAGELGNALSYEKLVAQFRWNLPVRYNIGVDVCDKHAADKGKLALIYDKDDGTHEKWTFWELKRASNRLANALVGMGVGQGDRVAVLLSQCPQLPVAHIATYKLGAICVPLFTLFGPEALLYRLNDSGARIVITDVAHAEQLLDMRGELPHLLQVIVIDGHVPGSRHWDDVLQQGGMAFTPVDTAPDDPAVIIYTSGTTGPAKGALHGHRILLGHLPGVSLPHDFMPQTGDLFWTPADWAWIGGLYDALFPVLHWGVPILAQRMTKFDPEKAFQLMEKWGVQNTFLPPTALKMMRQIEDVQSRWRLDLRTIACGGEPLGEEILRWGRDTLGVQIHEFYGQTECNVVVGNSSRLFEPKANSMGRPLPGHEVAVIDDAGQRVSSGVIGEIAVLTPDPVMFLNYWNRPEETQRKYLNGWLRTGDLGYVDEDGHFHFVGRNDDIISSAGYRIGPTEVEEVLLKHPAVAMVAVAGSPDEVRGEIVKAFVQVRDGVAGNEDLVADLQSWVKERLGAHEYPRSIEFVNNFPMTPSGKIQRGVLRKREYESRGK